MSSEPQTKYIMKKGNIRNFNFPQTFITIPEYNKSLSFFNRRLKDYSSESISSLRVLVSKETERSRVKIQQAQYISKDTNTQGILNEINRNKSLRPCRLSTLIRLLMLENLDDISREIIGTGICLAISHDTWFEVDIVNKKIRQLASAHEINEFTPIIIESEPI